MIEKLSEWFDDILKKHLPRGITVVHIDTGDLPHLISGIKELEEERDIYKDNYIETGKLYKKEYTRAITAESKIKELEAENKRLTEELAKKFKPTRQEIMNRRFTI